MPKDLEELGGGEDKHACARLPQFLIPALSRNWQQVSALAA